MTDKIQIIKDSIRDIPDFPKPGIVFKDISTLLNNPEAFKASIDLLEAKFKDKQIDYIAGIDSRGFIFGSALADRLGIGFVPVRKPGKLPAETIEVSYELEYGTDTVQVHKDAFDNGSSKRVVIVDDLLATGGTAAATAELVTKLGADLVALAFVVELDFLNGKEKLPKDTEIYSIVNY